MKYKCIDCNYETDIKFCYDRHMTSSKHVVAETVASDKIIYPCKYCPATYVRSINLSKHMTVCDKKDEYEVKIEYDIKDITNKYLIAQNQIKDLSDKYTKLETKYEELEKKYIDEIKQSRDKIEIRENKTDNKYTKLVENSGTIINNSLKTVNKTVSALTYIKENFRNAPPLRPMVDFSAFMKPKEGELVAEMIYHHSMKKLAQYIGDVYVKEYVKDDPTKQAVWNKDTSRLTYYVRVFISDTDPQLYEWITDKKGLKVIEFTIKPILNFLNKEIKKCSGLAKDGKIKVDNLLNYMQNCAEMNILIENKSLENEVLKYIAPKFDIDKVQQTLQLNGSQLTITSGNIDDEEEIDDDCDDLLITDDSINKQTMHIEEIVEDIAEEKPKPQIDKTLKNKKQGVMEFLDEFEKVEAKKRLYDDEIEVPRPEPKLKAKPVIKKSDNKVKIIKGKKK
jgi:hypothetical protein